MQGPKALEQHGNILSFNCDEVKVNSQLSSDLINGLVATILCSMSQSQRSDHARDAISLSSQTNNRTAIRKHSLPSCNICRRRKIRCDRTDPCSHCVRTGAVCVFSAPSTAPRGRQGGRRKHDSDLLNRIARLETLVKYIEGGPTDASPPVRVAGDPKEQV